jgi:2-oxoglutarate dehydrogenase E2 component (dihydrolipoamide succinyltransferase)
MNIKILVPSMGESIVEATVAHWLKKIGETVTVGEPLLDLETNKANVEVAAEQNGVLASIDKPDGQDVLVGETLGTISTEETGVVPPASPKMIQEPEPKAAPEAPAGVSTTVGATAVKSVTPVAMRIARENNLDLSRIAGSGPDGKVLKEDVERYLSEAGQAAPAATPAASRPADEQMPEIPAGREEQKPAGGTPIMPSIMSPALPASVDRREERIHLSRRRRTIAQKLVETQHAAAMLTTFNEVDMSAVMKIRQARKQLFKDKYGLSLGITSFFVKAAVLALKEFPRLNAEIQGDEMILKHYYDIGIAIGDEEGLVVPILREVDRLTFVEIEKTIQRFVQQTKEHKLSLEDLMGGTFTITNGGVFGSLMSTPILNGPEVGILGLHRIEDRPVAVEGQVAIRPMMYLALSYDHRIVDGREAVQFLARVKEAIQDPEILLLGV